MDAVSASVSVPAKGLLSELSETVLFLAIAGLTMAGWVGIALFFVSAMR
ncbi:MAG: hypothetical protein ABIS18_00510 [Actinomycetota bacterium]